MSKILDKFGIYELIGVLLSGISILTLSILVLQIVCKVPIDMDLTVNETLSFLVISYFIGLTFQETSSWILNKIILNEKNKLLKAALKTSDDSNSFLTETEKNGVDDYVKNKLGLSEEKDNDNIVYNYCKFHILDKEDIARIDKYQSLSVMSRILCLYFMMLTIFALGTLSFQHSYLKIILAIISGLLSTMMFARCIRFAKLRYVLIYRIFYYKVAVKQPSKVEATSKCPCPSKN